jgi:hypothetical protein
MRSFDSHRAGQGLLEATMAIGMILVGLGAVLTLTLQNVSATAASNQRVVALQLAREGVEVVRGIRDSNWLAAGHGDPSREWDTGLTPGAADCTSAFCGAAAAFTPPSEPQPSTNPGSFSLKFVPFDENRSNFSQPKLQFFRGDASEFYLWRQDTSLSLPASYQPTGYYRALMLDPVCKNDTSGSVLVKYNTSDGACDAGSTKIGYRVESQVAWPAAGLFGGVLRRSLGLVEFVYNWR